LVNAWREITGDSFIVDVRAADSPDAGLRYLLKYLSKEPDLGGEEGKETEENIRQTFNEAMKGVRLIHPFGSLYGYRHLRSSAKPCPTCGRREWLLVSILLDWPEGIFATDSTAEHPEGSPT